MTNDISQTLMTDGSQKTRYKGFIRSVIIDSTTDIILVNLQRYKKDTYKDEINCYYNRGQFWFEHWRTDKSDMELVDTYDIAIYEENPIEYKGEIIKYHIINLIKLPDRPTHKKPNWTDKRNYKMKELLNWSFKTKEVI